MPLLASLLELRDESLQASSAHKHKQALLDRATMTADMSRLSHGARELTRGVDRLRTGR
jgi:hypothetical protein